jgi:short-subunit dehydrogenase
MKVAIITGASSGIGSGVARELHRRGWAVGLIARRESHLQAMAEEMKDRVAYAVADVGVEEQVNAAVASLEQTLGPCDLMLANAGIGDARSARNFSAAATKKILNVNVEGVIHAMAAVVPGMVERGCGTVAATSSVASYRAMPNFGPYCASKAYVSSLMEAMRLDLRSSGIKVTTIHPGFVVSELTDQNAFPMPFLVSTDRASRIIANGLERGRAEINFPWQMTWLLKLVRLLPNWLFDPCVTAFSPIQPKKESE